MKHKVCGKCFKCVASGNCHNDSFHACGAGTGAGETERDPLWGQLSIADTVSLGSS